MKKKTRVFIISYTAALVAALAVGLIACRTDANRRQTAMDANYRHAYGEVLNAVQELDSSLQKSLYATTAAMECTVCTDIYSNAQTAEMALGVLPVNSHALERIARNIALAQCGGGQNVHIRGTGASARLFRCNKATEHTARGAWPVAL